MRILNYFNKPCIISHNLFFSQYCTCLYYVSLMYHQIRIFAVVVYLCFLRFLLLDIFWIMPDLTLLCFHFQFRLSDVPATATRSCFLNQTAAQSSKFFSCYIFFSNFFFITLLNIHLEFLSVPFYHPCFRQYHFFYNFYGILNS